MEPRDVELWRATVAAGERWAAGPRPEVPPALLWVWDAWRRLARQRRYGPHQPEPISAQDVRAHADLVGWSAGDRAEAYPLLEALDRVWMQRWRDAQPEPE